MAERIHDGFLDDVQIVFFRKNAIDFGENLAIDIDNDGVISGLF